MKDDQNGLSTNMAEVMCHLYAIHLNNLTLKFSTQEAIDKYKKLWGSSHNLSSDDFNANIAYLNFVILWGSPFNMIYEMSYIARP